MVWDDFWVGCGWREMKIVCVYKLEKIRWLLIIMEDGVVNFLLLVFLMCFDVGRPCTSHPWIESSPTPYAPTRVEGSFLNLLRGGFGGAPRLCVTPAQELLDPSGWRSC